MKQTRDSGHGLRKYSGKVFICGKKESFVPHQWLKYFEIRDITCRHTKDTFYTQLGRISQDCRKYCKGVKRLFYF